MTPVQRPYLCTGRVTVVGSLNLDRVAHLPGETLTGHNFAWISGGKGANRAAAAARPGAQVSMIGRVGDGPNGRTLDWICSRWSSPY
ncbi:hypothetical protein IHE30_06170 [Mycetohabitans sp. B46]